MAAGAVAIALAELQKMHTLLECRACPSLLTILENSMKKLRRIDTYLRDNDRQVIDPGWSGRLLGTLNEAVGWIESYHFKVAWQRRNMFNVRGTFVFVVWKAFFCWGMKKFVCDVERLLQDQYLELEVGTESNQGERTVATNSQCNRRVRLVSFLKYQESNVFLCHQDKMTELVERLLYTSNLNKMTEFVERLLHPSNLKGRMPLSTSIICGKEGLGKTFLVKAIYDRPEVKCCFPRRAWVHMSADMKGKHLLYEILKQVKKTKKDEQNLEEDFIRGKLYKKLMCKKILIVFDDVSQLDQLDSFFGCEVLPSTVQAGTHVIITTRSNESFNPVASEGELIKLDKLDETASKGLLRSKSDELEDVENILPRFDGSPLAISLWAGFLSTTGDPKARAASGDDVALPSIIDRSFRMLPLEIKPCFLYMALFPKAFPIPLRRLVRLWSAEGLLNLPFDKERKKDRITPEDVGEMYILELMNRDMIEVTSWRADRTPKTCQLLTCLYDQVRTLAIDACLIHIHDREIMEQKAYDSNRNQRYSRVQAKDISVPWLAEHTNLVRISNSSYLRTGYLRSFLSFNDRRGMLTEDIGTFLRNVISQNKCSLLKVLDLEGVYKPNMQDALKNLVLLTYLGLRSTMLNSIPDTIARLPYLETLDLKHTSITVLPSTFWKARNLRHLNLNWFYLDLGSIFKMCSENPGALSSLQTLTGLVGGHVKESLMSDHLNNLTTLTKLELYLECTWGETHTGIAEWIAKLTNLHSLKLGTIKDSELFTLPTLSLSNHCNLSALYLLGKLPESTDWNQLLPQHSLTVLTLSGSNVDDKCIHPLSRLMNLRTLRLLSNSFKDAVLNFTMGFDNLRVLKIWQHSELREVIIGDKAMLRLQELELRFLEVLEKVEGIEECPDLKNVNVLYRKDEPGFVKGFKKSSLWTTFCRKNKEDRLLVFSRVDETSCMIC